MRVRFGFVLALALSVLAARSASLPELLARPDPHYAWKQVSEERHPQGRFVMLELVSQGWRGPSEVDQPVWKHRLEVYLPNQVEHDLALLEITGGSRDKPGPGKPAQHLADIAIAHRCVVARLWDVPNQPLVFAADPEQRPRFEDQILAFAWSRAIGSGDPDWLAQVAMARSAVRAMDAVTESCARATTNRVQLKRFVLTGASKRGWTSWLAAAGDARVAGVAPKVIDMLNMEASFRHHEAMYGGYADAVQDYVRVGIPGRMGTPELEPSRKILDPWEHRDRLTMPKLIVNSTGDQFFLPDSWRFYWNDLRGPKYLRYVPNTDHGLNASAGKTVRTFYGCLLTGKPMPDYDWQETAPGTLRVHTRTRPLRVLAWRAANPKARDFMLQTIGPSWRSEEVKEKNVSVPGLYEARAASPGVGWAALLLEFHFPDPLGGAEPLILSTGVTVTPENGPGKR